MHAQLVYILHRLIKFGLPLLLGLRRLLLLLPLRLLHLLALLRILLLLLLPPTCLCQLVRHLGIPESPVVVACAEGIVDMQARERAGRTVYIRKLRKEFDTPDGVKVAVYWVALTLVQLVRLPPETSTMLWAKSALAS